jgi:hypothetical protein
VSIAQELSDLAYAAALQWVPLQGGITRVEREGLSVLIFGGKPSGLLGLLSAETCVQLAFSDGAAHAIILGGRKGIPQEQELFTHPVAGRPSVEVANDAVKAVSAYLATSTG